MKFLWGPAMYQKNLRQPKRTIMEILLSVIGIRQTVKVRLETFSKAAYFGEIIINATHGGSSIEALRLAEAKKPFRENPYRHF